MTKSNTKTTSTAAKKFFSKPSKLSTGNKNRRFKGSVRTMTYMQACTQQSDGIAV